MTEKTTKRDRRDWTLIIFLLPIGIIFMLIAGQIAIRLVPSWRVIGGMESNLDPNSASGGQPALFQPISFDILTPMSWLDSFLTPGPDSANQDLSFAPFVVFEPSETPSPVVSPTISNTPPTPTTTTTATTSPTVTTTWTRKPTNDPPTSTATTPAVCNDPAANNFGGPLPCTYDPPPVCSDPAANNFGDPLPCTYDSVTSTPEGSLVAATPTGFNIGAPNGNPVGSVDDGTYFVVNLSGNPIIVNGPSDTNYDFVYYELAAGSGILMDRVILSISTDDTVYYVVFNWGDGTPDANSNVGDVAGSETDNQPINASELYGTGTTDTGILVDVDNAPSHPPVATYQYLAIQAPEPPSVDNADVDAIEVTEVASPFP